MTIAINQILHMTEMQDRPSPILDAVISTWLEGEVCRLGTAPRWTGIQAEAGRLIDRALPGWWWEIGWLGARAGDMRIEFWLEPAPRTPSEVLLLDPKTIASLSFRLDPTNPEEKHICLAMVEATFRALLLIETNCAPSRN